MGNEGRWVFAAGGTGRGDGLRCVGPGARRDWCVTKRGCRWGIIDCCFSPPPCLGGGGVWGHHLPILFSRLVLVQCCRGCGVAITATAIPVLMSGQFLPSPVPGMCTSGAALGRGERAGIVSFGAISVMSAMVVSVFWRVRECVCCRVYMKFGTNV